MEFVQQAVQKLPELPQFDCTVYPREMVLALKNLSQHKARGTDGFSNSELKWLSRDLLTMLLTLFNSIILRTGWYVPQNISSMPAYPSAPP